MKTLARFKIDFDQDPPSLEDLRARRAELEKLKLITQARLARGHKGGLFFCFGCAALVGLAICSVLPSPREGIDTAIHVSTGVLAGMGLMLISLLILVTKRMEAAELCDRLEAESRRLDVAPEAELAFRQPWINAHPSVATYRSKALAQGRDLIGEELGAMGDMRSTEVFAAGE